MSSSSVSSSSSSSLQEKQMALQKKREAYMQLRLEANAIRAILNRKERDKQEALELQRESERLRRLEEAEQREAERQKAEYLHKNKEYFNLGRAYREVPPPGAPVFYGDNINVFGAWVPEGHGQFTMFGIVQYEGAYRNGKRDGLGTATYADGSKWQGQFRNGNAHGAGTFTPGNGSRPNANTKVRSVAAPTSLLKKKDNVVAAPTPSFLDVDYKANLDVLGILPHRPAHFAEEDEEANHHGTTKHVEVILEPAEAIMNNNLIICFKSELIPGVQVEFDDPSLNITSHHCDHSLPRAILLHHICKWRYKFRFQDQMQPREREVNLEFVRYFKIMSHLPRIILLSHIDLPMDETNVYDYYKDTFGSNVEPQFGIGLGRKTEEMKNKHHLPPLKAKQRTYIPRNSLNIFESGLSGSDTAKELELKALQIEYRRKQWAMIVDHKRQQEEEERHRQIVEVQAQIAQQEKEEMENFRKALALEVDDAMSKFSSAPNSLT